jgi:AhpD family alkylhydroperoxidase
MGFFMATATTTAAPRLDYRDFHQIVPEFANGMATITQALKKSRIEPEIRELVKIRASQLNGCAFCIQFHLNDARKIGIPAEKLDLLTAWREAGIYSEREAAALEWTEYVTLLAQHHIDDAAFARVKALFPDDQLVLLTVAISQINAWNRVAAPFQFAPPISRTV